MSTTIQSSLSLSLSLELCNLISIFSSYIPCQIKSEIKKKQFFPRSSPLNLSSQINFFILFPSSSFKDHFRSNAHKIRYKLMSTRVKNSWDKTLQEKQVNEPALERKNGTLVVSIIFIVAIRWWKITVQPASSSMAPRGFSFSPKGRRRTTGIE